MSDGSATRRKNVVRSIQRLRQVANRRWLDSPRSAMNSQRIHTGAERKVGSRQKIRAVNK